MSKWYSKYQDEELWSLFVANDKQAFACIYEKYKKPIFSFFYNRLYQNPQNAQDATQTLFLKLIEKKVSFNASYSFRTWIYSIANNLCKNEYRSRGVRAKYSSKEAQISNPENYYDKAQFEELFTETIQQLKDEQLEVFLLRYQSHLSITEISKILNLAEGTVKSRLFYTIKKLSKHLLHFKHIDLKKVDLWKI